MTIDERIEALTQSVELLASIHKDHETAAAEREARFERLRDALLTGVAAFLQALKD